MKGVGGQAHEAIQIFAALEGEALLGQHLHLDLQRDDFAVDQDTVAIENDRLKVQN